MVQMSEYDDDEHDDTMQVLISNVTAAIAQMGKSGRWRRRSCYLWNSPGRRKRGLR